AVRRAAGGRRRRRKSGRGRGCRRLLGRSWLAPVEPGFAETGDLDALAAPGVGNMNSAVAAEQQGRVGEFGAAVGGGFDAAAGLPGLTVVGRNPQEQGLAAVRRVAGEQQAAALQAEQGDRGIRIGDRQGLASRPALAAVRRRRDLDPARARPGVAQQGQGALRVEGDDGRLQRADRVRHPRLVENLAGRRQAQPFAVLGDELVIDRQAEVCSLAGLVHDWPPSVDTLWLIELPAQPPMPTLTYHRCSQLPSTWSTGLPTLRTWAKTPPAVLSRLAIGCGLLQPSLPCVLNQ